MLLNAAAKSTFVGLDRNYPLFLKENGYRSKTCDSGGSVYELTAVRVRLLLTLSMLFLTSYNQYL